MIADFYHLARSPLERVLPRICEKLLTQGERLLVVGEPELIDSLDHQLWSYARDGFLPHGRAADPGFEEQPILLSGEASAANGARNIAIVDGLWREDALGFNRAFYFFDDSHLQHARSSWAGLKGRADVERRYWSQDERGRWVEGP